ncbi:MAG: hypothetical protein WCI73_11635 [Phycisphaerae bacterium]
MLPLGILYPLKFFRCGLTTMEEADGFGGLKIAPPFLIVVVGHCLNCLD